MVRYRNVLFVVFVLVLAASACDAVPGSIFSEPGPSPTAVRNVLATRQKAFPTAIPPAATPIPAPTLAPYSGPMPTEPAPPPAIIPTVSAPDSFCCLHFAAGPNAQAADTFPAGTEIVYAIWDYTDLAQGDRVRRIWIRDDLIWLAREEKWDWDTYGAAGTVRDLSIFDFEGDGLQSANYRLQVYLNDTLQEEAAFVILPP